MLSSCSLPRQARKRSPKAGQLVKGLTRAMLLKLRDSRHTWLAVKVVRQSGNLRIKTPPALSTPGSRPYTTGPFRAGQQRINHGL